MRASFSAIALASDRMLATSFAIESVSPARSARTRSASPMIPVSGLLISCRSVMAMAPTAATRSASTSRSCVSLRHLSVASMARTRPASAASRSRMRSAVRRRARSESARSGFDRNSSAPASSAASMSSPAVRAVSTMKQTYPSAARARTRRQTSRPLMSGRFQSDTTIAGDSRSSLWRASAPLVAAVGS